MRDANLMLNTTGGQVVNAAAISANIIDVEQYLSIDQQKKGWLNIRVLAVSFTGLTEGMRIELVSSDSTGLATTNIPLVGTGILLPAHLVAGAVFSVGFIKDNLKKYIGLNYSIVSTAFTGTGVTFDCDISNEPITSLKIQKMPT